MTLDNVKIEIKIQASDYLEVVFYLSSRRH
jgi:hypothetical protein